MKRILCYGDSNTWGFNPTEPDKKTGMLGRYPEHVRWTGVLSDTLGDDYTVCEEGLCGRTTVFEDPTHYGWNGYTHFEVALRSCDPVDCVVLMLGTNDTKDLFHASPATITGGMERLLKNCQNLLRGSLSQDAKIILACPLRPEMAGDGKYWYDFSEESTRKIEAMRETYRALAARSGVAYFDINEYGAADPADGIHMDAESHRRVGAALAELVKELIG